MLDRLWIVVALVWLFAVAQFFLRRGKARDAALAWLKEHGYHANKLEIPWIASSSRFNQAAHRDDDNALFFRAEVVDRKLGGTGILWMRVWVDGRGTEVTENDVSWEAMPAGFDAAPPGEPWEIAQLALLVRIASGEQTFRSRDSRNAEAGAAFDLEVEHLMAMSRRGLITCATPVAESRIPGRSYAYVTDVKLTAEGKRIAARGTLLQS